MHAVALNEKALIPTVPKKKKKYRKTHTSNCTPP
jgi:hypothetical protein